MFDWKKHLWPAIELIIYQAESRIILRSLTKDRQSVGKVRNHGKQH